MIHKLPPFDEGDFLRWVCPITKEVYIERVRKRKKRVKHAYGGFWMPAGSLYFLNPYFEIYDYEGIELYKRDPKWRYNQADYWKNREARLQKMKERKQKARQNARLSTNNQ